MFYRLQIGSGSLSAPGRARTGEWSIPATQKLRVESKEAMRNRGVSSPDRADVVFGAMGCAGGGGAITAETLKWIKFGSTRVRFFEGEPVRFE